MQQCAFRIVSRQQLCCAFFHILCSCNSSCATSCHSSTCDSLHGRVYLCLVYICVEGKLYKYAMWPLTISLTTFTLTFFTILFASRHYFPHHTQLKILLILYEVCTLLISLHFLACSLQFTAHRLFFPFNCFQFVGAVHHLSKEHALIRYAKARYIVKQMKRKWRNCLKRGKP